MERCSVFILSFPKSNPMYKKVTKIPVRVSTRELLKSLGKKGDTYDKIILELIEIGRGVEKKQ